MYHFFYTYLTINLTISGTDHEGYLLLYDTSKSQATVMANL